MPRDLNFYSYIFLIGAGVLTVAGFVLLIYLLRPVKIKQVNLAPDQTESQFNLADNTVNSYFTDQNLFKTNSFGFYFYYPQDWFVTDNGEYRQDDFLTKNNPTILNGWVLSTFNNPDYQLGKQATMIIKVVANPDQLDIKHWLAQYDKNSDKLDEKLSDLSVASLTFYQLDQLENQVYIPLPSDEILVLTAVCGQYSQCLGDKEANQQIFVQVLSSLTLGQPSQE